METYTEQEQALAALLLARWEQVSQKIEELALEFPEQDYAWRPGDGVRSCGEVVRHVAFWNEYVSDSLRGKAANQELNEVSASDYSTKAKMLEALRRSAEGVAAALREQSASGNPKAAELVMPFLEHTSEHYGQLAVYARMLAIVPPASRA